MQHETRDAFEQNATNPMKKECIGQLMEHVKCRKVAAASRPEHLERVKETIPSIQPVQ